MKRTAPFDQVEPITPKRDPVKEARARRYVAVMLGDDREALMDVLRMLGLVEYPRKAWRRA